MDPKEAAIRSLADARRRGDFEAARALITDEIAWHEPGEADYSGDHHGAEVVVRLWRDLARATLATFDLRPEAVIVTDDHAAARTHWHAEREGVRVEGNELAVYRFDQGRIAEAWFWYDGYDQAAHDVVFRLGPA